MSGDIFKKAFSKSSEEVRQRTSGGTSKQKKTKRDFVRDIKADIENLISQIPPVFEVSDVHFHERAGFVVHLPQDDTGILFEKTVLEVIIIVPDDEKSKDGYVASILRRPWNSLRQPPPSSRGTRDEVIEKLSLNLGRILGEEYERRIDFYKRLEEGL
jgi:hypothetical protein